MLGVARAKTVHCLLLAAALCAPFVLVAATHGVLAERAAIAAVGALLRLTQPLAPAGPKQPDGVQVAAGVVTPAAAALGSATAKAPQSSKRAAPSAKPKALFISAANVLALAKTAAQPSGSFVPKTELHPAGVRLLGVGALGIGVEDGDILVEALGFTPRSSGQIIGAIIEARAQRVRYLSGTLWRKGQTLRITVEQPYLDPA